MNLEAGLLGFFWLADRDTRDLKHVPTLTITLGKPNAPPGRVEQLPASSKDCRSKQICTEPRKLFLGTGKSC